MTLNDITLKLDKIFNIQTAEDFDNVGLLCGHPTREITGILVCHDALEKVVDEAIEKHLNLIVSFHPIIFSGLKSLTGKNYVEKAVLKAIENKIAIYAVHTAWDNDFFGVNFAICEALGLQNQHILMPKSSMLKKLEVYVPTQHVDNVRDAILNAGAGSIGFYDECSFSVAGQGTFRPKAGANPFIGEKNKRESVDENIITCIFERYKQSAVIKAMLEAHPYEEVAYQILSTENQNPYVGLGRYGDLEYEMEAMDFLQWVKETLNLKVIRHSDVTGKKIKRVGVLGGSGVSGIKSAISSECDAYLTGDYKYHDFFMAEGRILLCDIGHFESEQFVMQQLFDILSENFPKFAISKSSLNTNPINYFL